MDDLEKHFEMILVDILVSLGSISTHVDDMLDRFNDPEMYFLMLSVLFIFGYVLCYVILCNVMLCCVMLCYAIVCYVVLC